MERAQQVESKLGHTHRLATGAEETLCRSSRAQSRALGSHGSQPLTEARPRPRLDLAVAERGLAARRLEVLEPGVGFLDQQQLLGFWSGGHDGIVGPPPDGNRF